jgi:EF hand
MEIITMNLKTVLAIAVAAALAAPLAAQASADADKIIVAQTSGSTMQPKDSNPAAPPAAHGPGKTESSAGATAKGGFAAMDKNKDGHISRDEAKNAAWENRFSELDKDNDNRLSQSEFDAMQAGAGASAKPNKPKQ